MRVAHCRVTTGRVTGRGLAPTRCDVWQKDESQPPPRRDGRLGSSKPPCAGRPGGERGTAVNGDHDDDPSRFGRAEAAVYRDNEAVSRLCPIKALNSASSCCCR
jgi:hypothetical protein